MRIDELNSKAKFDKNVADATKKLKELKALSQKVKQMYAKAIQDYERVETENAEKFDSDPYESFKGWFQHMFKTEVEKAVAIPGLTISDANIKKIGKLIIAYASQNYFLKPKTPFAGANTFMKIVKAIDPQLVSVADTIFGRFVRGEEQKNPTPVPDDMKAVLQNLTPEQRKQLQDLISKAGDKA
jgi:hypothetical protein